MLMDISKIPPSFGAYREPHLHQIRHFNNSYNIEEIYRFVLLVIYYSKLSKRIIFKMYLMIRINIMYVVVTRLPTLCISIIRPLIF